MPETLTDTSRRLAVLRVTPEMIVAQCKAGPPHTIEVVANPLPSDAETVGVVELQNRTLGILIQSAAFALVPDDASIADYPVVPDPQFRLLDPTMQPEINLHE